MASVVDERGDDLVIRWCAAGQGKPEMLRQKLAEAGFETDPRAANGRITRLVKKKAILRALPGFYVPVCPHCGEPFLNVLGAEH